MPSGYEDLITKIEGDASRYLSELKKSISETDKFARSVERDTDKAARKLKENTDKMAGGLGNLSTAAIAVGGAFATWGAFKEFATAELAENRLRAALQANGREVDSLMSDYKEFADELSQTTLATDDQVYNLLRLDEIQQLSGRSAQRAAKNALALAAATGKSSEEAAKATAALEHGITEPLERLIPILKTYEDQSEKVAKAQEILANAHNIATSEVNTAHGSIVQTTKAWNDAKKAIGSALASTLGPAIEVIRDIVTEFKDAPPWIHKTVGAALVLTTTIAGVTTVVSVSRLAFGGLAASVGGYVTMANVAIVRSLALKGALVGGVAFGAYELGKVLSDVEGKTRQFNEAMEESQKLNDKWAMRFTKSTDSVLKGIDSIEDESKRRKVIKVEVEKAERELRGLTSAVNASKREVDDLNTRWNRLWGVKTLEAAKHGLDDAKRKLELAATHTDKLRDRLKNLESPIKNAKLAEDIAAFEKELRIAAATISMTSEEVRLYKLQLDGASEAMLRGAKAQIEFNKQADKLKVLGKEVADAIKAVDDEIRFMGFTADEVKFGKLADQLREAEKGIQEAFGKEQTLGALLLFGREVKKIEDSLEKLAKGLERKKELEELFKMFEEGKRITEETLTPIEQFEKRISRLKELLDKEFITQDVFGRAVEMAQKQLDDLTKKTDKATKAAERLDAALFGSQEARQRIADFLEIKGTRRREVGPMPRMLEIGPSPREIRELAPGRDERDFKEADVILLRDIRDILSAISKKPPIIINSAGIS